MIAPKRMEHSPGPPTPSACSDRRLRVLFIARAFPPTIGGMENLAFQLSTHLSAYADVRTTINHGGKKALPVFLPRALASAVAAVRSEHVDVVHLADALLAPLGAAIKLATGAPVTASVCGLDVTYSNRLYRAVVPRALRRLDLAMPISAATLQAMRERTGDALPARVIPLGVNPIPAPHDASIAELRGLVRIADESPVILTVGRLVGRKGVAWFVRNVLPHLAERVTYVVAGEGPQRETILAAASHAGVTNRVRLLGRVSGELLAAAYARADVFVMPNVPVAGDMEGFGLVALEAASSELPVVASRLEGITEALCHENNGVLVAPEDAAAYVRELSVLLAMSREERRAIGARAAAYTRERFGWDRTTREYIRAMESVVRDRSNHDVAGTSIES